MPAMCVRVLFVERVRDKIARRRLTRDVTRALHHALLFPLDIPSDPATCPELDTDCQFSITPYHAGSLLSLKQTFYVVARTISSRKEQKCCCRRGQVTSARSPDRRSPPNLGPGRVGQERARHEPNDFRRHPSFRSALRRPPHLLHRLRALSRTLLLALPDHSHPCTRPTDRQSCAHGRHHVYLAYRPPISGQAQRARVPRVQLWLHAAVPRRSERCGAHGGACRQPEPEPESGGECAKCTTRAAPLAGLTARVADSSIHSARQTTCSTT